MRSSFSNILYDFKSDIDYRRSVNDLSAQIWGHSATGRAPSLQGGG